MNKWNAYSSVGTIVPSLPSFCGLQSVSDMVIPSATENRDFIVRSQFPTGGRGPKLPSIMLALQDDNSPAQPPTNWVVWLRA